MTTRSRQVTVLRYIKCSGFHQKFWVMGDYSVLGWGADSSVESWTDPFSILFGILTVSNGWNASSGVWDPFCLSVIGWEGQLIFLTLTESLCNLYPPYANLISVAFTHTVAMCVFLLRWLSVQRKELPIHQTGTLLSLLTGLKRCGCFSTVCACLPALIPSLPCMISYSKTYRALKGIPIGLKQSPLTEWRSNSESTL